MKVKISIMVVAALVFAGCGDGNGSDATNASDATASDDATDDAVAVDDAVAGDDAAAVDEGSGAESDEAVETTADDPLQVGIIFGPPGRNDLGWFAAGYAAAEALQEEGVWDFELVENVTPDTAALEQVVNSFIDNGAELIIAHSASFGAAIMEIAPKHPDVAFQASSASGLISENVADISLPTYEGGYIAGILGAGASETGIIGGVAGFEIPPCTALFNAVLDGGRSVRPDFELRTAAVGSWTDGAKTRESVIGLADQGVDVVIGCGTEVFVATAAAELEIDVIGALADQSELAPDQLIGTIFYDPAPMWRQIVSDVETESFLPAKFYNYGMSDGATYFATNPSYAGSIPAEFTEAAEAATAQIASGALVVAFDPEPR